MKDVADAHFSRALSSFLLSFVLAGAQALQCQGQIILSNNAFTVSLDSPNPLPSQPQDFLAPQASQTAQGDDRPQLIVGVIEHLPQLSRAVRAVSWEPLAKSATALSAICLAFE
jgi:hypothetical protein